MTAAQLNSEVDGSTWIPSSSNEFENTCLHLEDDDNSSQLNHLLNLLDAEGGKGTDENASASKSEIARQLLDDLDSKQWEDVLQESYVPTVDSLPVFEDLTCITPVTELEPPSLDIDFPREVLRCLAPNVDADLLRDLEAMLTEVTPPQSPPVKDECSDIEEFLYMRSVALLDPEPGAYLPPTPSTITSSPQVSPYASPATFSPEHVSSFNNSSPIYAPSTPDSQIYHSTPSPSWDSDANSSDPDWTMDDAPGPSSERVSSTRRATKPNFRSGGRVRKPEDRRERKKLQNKNAATRYRLKKKAEEEVILTEEKELMDTNSELQAKVSDLSNEIRIIRGLLKDHCKRLGILPKE